MNPLITMRSASQRPVEGRLRPEMRMIRSVLVISLAVILGPGLFRVTAADEDGVALGILYDTSGSMKEPVPDSHGSTSPKYVIANRAVLAIVKQIQAFTASGTADAPHKVDVGLFIFDKDGAKEVVKLAPFDAGAIQNRATNFTNPTGGTPL